MPKPAHVPLHWKMIDWLPEDTYKKHLVPKLEEVGIKPVDLKRSVYVIRLNGNYAIDYANGESPTIYVGGGNFFTRIDNHKSWVREIRDLVGPFSFQVCIATPRVKNNFEAYLDAEAAIWDRFGELFKTAPLWNKQFENRRCEHYEYSQQQIDYVLRKRSGAKYKWAIRPMKASMFYSAYNKTSFE